MKHLLIVAITSLTIFSCTGKVGFDTILRNGTVYDGNGGTPFVADIAISADTIAFIGDLKNASAKSDINAKGMAVSPGFINMLSWAGESLIEDGRSQGDIRQGVTLEIMGEGSSMGPLNNFLRKQMIDNQTDIKYKVEWTTLGEYLSFLEKNGVSCNVASFVGAGTLRTYAVGESDRRATAAELDTMRSLVRQSMEEGAMGIGSSLIYPPDCFAGTDELIALCKEASRYGGSYISHMRSEGNRLCEGIEELITIAKEARVHAEIYHLKAAGRMNWHKMDSVINRIEKARADGINISADMYTYTAAATGLTSCFPPSLQDGGFDKLWARLQVPAIRKQMVKEMTTNANDWENFYFGVGSPDKIILLAFKQDSLKKYTGKTLAEVAKIRGRSPEETAIDLIVQDSTRIGVAYFLMNEENVKKQMSLPWVSFGSDAESCSSEGVFLKSNPHPRAYGNFTRVISKYSQKEHIFSLQEAIRKLSGLPATNLKLKKRGELKTGNFADILIFDPAKMKDNSTFENPHQYSSGMIDVFVNGVQVLKDGEHTGAKPGRFIKGPGYKIVQ